MKRGRNQRRRQGGSNPNRALDSNGPDVRIRGTANQIYDKYVALARDASSSGDRIKAESYLQHAEHYFRLIRAAQPPQQQQPQQQQVDGDGDQPNVDENSDEKSADRKDNARGDRRRDEGDARPARNKDAAKSGAGDDEDASSGADADAEAKPKRKRVRRPKRAEADAGESESERDTAAAAAE